MFNDSYLRACMKLRTVQKIRFSLLESAWTQPWCSGLVSRPCAKAQEPVARSRGLVIQPPKLSVGAYFELSFLGYGFLIHLSNRSAALDSEPRGRRYVKNTRHNRNCLYSRAIHCPASMEKNQAMVPGFDVSAECQSIGTSGKKQRACYLTPKTINWCIF